MNKHLTAEQAFKPELRQGDAEWEAYKASRPDGSLADTDQYFEDQREAAREAGNVAYENMPVPQLARKVAEAEYYGDVASTENIYKVLNSKLDTLDERYFSERDDGSTHSTRNFDTNDKNHNELRSEKLWDRVMTIRDKERARLQGNDAISAEAAHEDDETPSAETDSSEDVSRLGPEHEGDAPNTAGGKVESDEAEAIEPPEVEDEGNEDETIRLPEVDVAETENANSSENSKSEPPTEEMPTRVQPDQQATRYARFKRGVRRHLYEAPVKETPMGPATQPDIPFDEWYETKQKQGPSALSRAATKTAEKLGDFTEFVDYVGNVALTHTANIAVDAAHYTQERLKDAKEATTKTAKKAGRGAEKFTRAVDRASNVALVGFADAATPIAERRDNASWKVGYMGRVVLDKMTAITPQMREYITRSTRRETGETSKEDEAKTA